MEKLLEFELDGSAFAGGSCGFLEPCGGRSLKEQRRALREFTEAPILQGHLERPWDRLVGGVILEEAAEAQRIRKGLQSNRKEQTPVRKLERMLRPDWPELVAATERQLESEVVADGRTR